MLLVINWRYCQAGKNSRICMKVQGQLMQVRLIESHQVFANKIVEYSSNKVVCVCFSDILLWTFNTEWGAGSIPSGGRIFDHYMESVPSWGLEAVIPVSKVMGTNRGTNVRKQTDGSYFGLDPCTRDTIKHEEGYVDRGKYSCKTKKKIWEEYVSENGNVKHGNKINWWRLWRIPMPV